MDVHLMWVSKLYVSVCCEIQSGTFQLDLRTSFGTTCEEFVKIRAVSLTRR